MSQHWRQSRWDPDATILIVDDSRLNRELLVNALSPRGKFRFLEAGNGQEAVDQLQSHHVVDLILLDLIMPVMDGFDFLKWRQGNRAAQDIPVIVNSSLDDLDSLSEALGMDCYDYFVKPLQPRELELVLPLKIRNAINARRMVAKLRAKNQTMAHDLALAARYQHFLLPAEGDLPGVKAQWLYQPCRELGGDYFDFFPLPGGRLGLVVADVSGHGVASAMTASILKALLPVYLERSLSPAAALTELNLELVNLIQDDGFVTVFLGLYDPSARTLHWCSAGHPAPLSLPPGGPPRWLFHPGFFLGVFSEEPTLVSFEDKEMRLEPGHRLILYTDGYVEALDPANQPLGLERLEELASRHSQLPAAELIGRLRRELEQHTQGEVADDVALIVMDF